MFELLVCLLLAVNFHTRSVTVQAPEARLLVIEPLSRQVPKKGWFVVMTFQAKTLERPAGMVRWTVNNGLVVHTFLYHTYFLLE
jgi:hypothetical protein